jgi:hypothetical protein
MDVKNIGMGMGVLHIFPLKRFEML